MPQGQNVAESCNMLRSGADRCGMLQNLVECRKMLQKRCEMLQIVVKTCWKTLQSVKMGARTGDCYGISTGNVLDPPAGENVYGDLARIVAKWCGML